MRGNIWLKKLGVCASCEWIYTCNDELTDCPQCGFGSYGARFVYGNIAYKYAKTQQPWFDKKVSEYKITLNNQIRILAGYIDSQQPSNIGDIYKMVNGEN